MTDRLYYHDSFLYDFDAEVRDYTDAPRPALILDRTAFYPTSGGQVFDTGAITFDNAKFKVTEVVDTEDGRVVHYLEAPVKNKVPGTRVSGPVYPAPPPHHKQPHPGQHQLPQAFLRLYNMPTVSFHMADD